MRITDKQAYIVYDWDKELKPMAKMLSENFRKAVRAPHIRKPFAWALYQTWKYFDVNEMEKKEMLIDGR